ncbi:hypothetical protein [Streptomyces sp. SID1121]|uniref:hypothetical protein n=1 Tax=Streptomyces sp. SID1121 TaxID=3425888 RepID=UPI004055C6B8
MSEPVRALGAGRPDVSELFLAPWRELLGDSLCLEVAYFGLKGTGPGSLRLAARTLKLADRLGVRAVVDAGDRLWDSHAGFVKDTHQPFLISYSLAKGPERSDPLDPASAPTGRPVYVLNECYRSSADISKHWKITAAQWPDFQAILRWMRTPGIQVVTLHDGQVRNAAR